MLVSLGAALLCWFPYKLVLPTLMCAQPSNSRVATGVGFGSRRITQDAARVRQAPSSRASAAIWTTALGMAIGCLWQISLTGTLLYCWFWLYKRLERLAPPRLTRMTLRNEGKFSFSSDDWDVGTFIAAFYPHLIWLSCKWHCSPYLVAVLAL